MDTYLSYYVHKDHPDWSPLAELDSSEAYEVDVTEIWKTPTGFALVSASGCSCWNGEYDAEEFANLTALEKSMELEDRDYNASPRGSHELLAEAREKYGQFAAGLVALTHPPVEGGQKPSEADIAAMRKLLN